MIEQARSDGQIATADQYPYIASSTSLEAVLIPTWARAGGDAALLARFDDPEIGARLRDELAQEIIDHDNGAQVRIARFAAHPEWAGLNLLEIADANGMTVVELVEYITRHEGAAVVNFGMNEDDVRAIMQIEWVATASDGRATLPAADRPHPRFYGTFPRKIGYYAIRESVLPMEQAVCSATSLPADIIGMTDRGRLAAGQFADVVVFDPNTFVDEATYDDPHRYASGLKYVWVNGVVAVYDEAPTGALAGRALRHVSAE
jgi:N-acyl-D-aspartate/D-glutamate deacylase